MSTKSFDREETRSIGYDGADNQMEVMSALKTFLIEREMDNGKSLFSHLKDCVKKILEERPNNALDNFEGFSRRVGDDTTEKETNIEDISIDLGLAEIQKDLFLRGDGDEDEPVPEDDIETPLPDMMLTSFFFEQAGLVMNREEVYRVLLAMKKLVNTQPVEKARFWGKIFGTLQNYYVAEVEFREGEELEEEEEEGEAEEDNTNENRQDDDEEPEDLPPKSNWKPTPPVPKEEFRTGANKKIYFVCNEPGKSWVRLPMVTPAQIQVARKIKKFFTGSLDSEVKSNPVFPGLEINLLRAQIARISAGTQISPIGFFTFDNDEEELEEDAVQDNYIENVDYAPLHLKELADTSFSNWVHHTNHILPQGRTLWWNPSQKGEDELEEEEDEESEEAVIEPERGPALLTPINQDVSIDGLQPWSARISSMRIPEYGVAVISSNLWPGAHAFAFGKHFDNVYIGWGFKQNQNNYAPCPTDPILKEYIEGKEITEIADPTPQEEEALKASKTVENEEEQEEEEEEEDI